MKKVIILGATGSIGLQTLDVIRHDQTNYQLVGIAYGENHAVAHTIIQEFQPAMVVSQTTFPSASCYPNISFGVGDSALRKLVSDTLEDTIIVNAIAGSAGLMPTYYALLANKLVLLANKESLVMAGELINQLLAVGHGQIIPIDSEHSAILQLLDKHPKNEINKLILTASGGPFLNYTREELAKVTLTEAMHHPNWNMGFKVTIDSATMMNKAFEIIEAHYLFHVAPEQIQVVIHPESIVHSLVEWNDCSIFAQMAQPDMRIPIAYALNYPAHLTTKLRNALDLTNNSGLHFYAADQKRFIALDLAYLALKKKGFYPVVMNAANEALVQLFKANKITFQEIDVLVKATLEHNFTLPTELTFANIIAVDALVKEYLNQKYQ